MTKVLNALRQRKVLFVAVFVGTLLVALSKRSPLQASLVFQSELPPPANPYFILSDSGGRVYCGLQQSSVWIDAPSGFTSENGAEFHCDPTDSISQWVGSSGAWDDQGYLIGFWPTGTPIIKPLILTFEIDPAKASGICSSCFDARYYNSGNGQWRSLLTTYDTATSRIYVQINEYLPASGYSGYADRFVIALFTQSTPTPTAQPTSTSSPASTATPTAKPTSTATPTAKPTSTATPIAKPTSTLTPYPTMAISTPQPTSSPICPSVGVFVVALVPLVSVYLQTHREGK